MRKNRKLTLKRRLTAKMHRQTLYDPRDFLSPQRIDVAAKTVFARAYLENNTSSWPEEVYKEHIRAFNNFYEEEPGKSTYEEFRDSFLHTIDGVKNDDSWKHKAPVIKDNNFLLNGSHRVAASLAVNDMVNAVSAVNEHGHNWNYKFFSSDRGEIQGIRDDVLDYMTIEYVTLKPKNIFAVIIFPAAEGYRQEAFDHLSSLGEIVNMKSFKYDEFIGNEVVKQLYFDSQNDAWNYGNNFDGAKNKAKGCFDGVGDLQVYILESDMDEPKRIEEKQYLRDLWKKDKHSIHITDTIDEANRVVRMFFNKNSRDFMKIDREREFSSDKLYNLFYEYIKLLPSDPQLREHYAIEGSAVFDLHNIRSGNDIDYISRLADDISVEGIERHSEAENAYHDMSVDELLTNPKYYFYYKGYKIITLKEMLIFKEHRSVKGDKKDSNDVKLIKRFLESV